MLKYYLRVFCDKEKPNWAYLLAEAEFIYNNVINTITKVAPFEALMGFNPLFYN